MALLLSTSSRVEAPIIGVKIGDAIMGVYSKADNPHCIEMFGKYYSATKVIYPNYIQSLTVTKVNNAVNTYSLTLEYAITPTDDPNLIDKILSKVSKTREITFMYGDATSPNFLYREEKGMITQIKAQTNIRDSKIIYNISATSTALQLSAAKPSFDKTFQKPSTVIRNLLSRRDSGLLDVFYGMSNADIVNDYNLIPVDDKEVEIEAQDNLTVLDYLKYLVSIMVPDGDPDDSLQKTVRYVLVIHDGKTDEIPGPYFSIRKIINSAPTDTSIDIYEIDIGVPSKDLVYSFVINDDQAYSILYEYNNEIKSSDIVYRIADNGELEEIYSPTIAKNSVLQRTTEREKTWWSQVTQFPINATLTIKGLLRATTLMSYIRVRVYFYGKKHIMSGLYIITKQEDSIKASGFTTTLSLTKIQGDSFED